MRLNTSNKTSTNTTTTTRISIRRSHLVNIIIVMACCFGSSTRSSILSLASQRPQWALLLLPLPPRTVVGVAAAAFVTTATRPRAGQRRAFFTTTTTTSTTSLLPQPITTTTQLWAGRRRRQSGSSSPTDNKNNNHSNNNNELSWETFEFGDSPKWDDRFESSRTVVASNAEDLQAIQNDETRQDVALAAHFENQVEGWQRLDVDLVARATEILLPYVRPARIERIHAVLQQRTQHLRFLFENPVNPSNVWACLRTLDAFGIQHVHVVLDSAQYQGKAALSQKRGMRTAMGSAQWLTLRNHASTTEAIHFLRDQLGCVILASDLSDKSKDIRDIDWDAYDNDENDVDMVDTNEENKSADDKTTPMSGTTTATTATSKRTKRSGTTSRPICIVMGNEERGISETMREAADGTFYLPMSGFAESFNLSVATAITAAHLSAASSSSSSGTGNGDGPQSQQQQQQRGPLRPGDLSEHEYNCLFLKGLLNSVAQKRVAYALLKQQGIVLPSDIHLV